MSDDASTQQRRPLSLQARADLAVDVRVAGEVVMSPSDNHTRLEIVADLLRDIEELCGARGGSRDELEAAMEKIDRKATTARFVLAEVVDP